MVSNKEKEARKGLPRLDSSTPHSVENQIAEINRLVYLARASKVISTLFSLTKPKSQVPLDSLRLS
jgi:hypothetical protein